TPLFFLDYLATARLVPDVAAAIVGGVHRACKENDVALLGGETAEMPGLYHDDDFDLAGTIVGVVNLEAIPHAERIVSGDTIVALPAQGMHTNGYSLARALIPQDEWKTFADALLAPHPSYLKEVRAIGAAAQIKAMAHITGGGLYANVARTLPENAKAIVEQTRWNVPPIMRELIRRGNLAHEERYRSLNMGIGFTLVVSLADAPKALAAAPGAFVAGWIEARAKDEPAVVVHPARQSE
ncbi:MAG: phosphoribosylformylglycinamidine cyclo-ligase, partial [Candidatus Eremiobacteraeota bacterium]|nr:phosphoribosylformylglycinamidine cyclo-ligase [Candidatus Eremiobacteraeota bacterium]MBV8356300.1 phosphoribosylformylglycinamidine cyclo-ligase [Candidatus Eremiobacteraeota bacterium]